MRRLVLASTAALLCASSLPLSAQDNSSADEASARSDTQIIVEGNAADDDENLNEKVRRIGRAITRPQRSGKPAARLDDPLCLFVSGMPADFAAVLKARVEDNARKLRGVKVNTKEGCSPNAFLGFLNNVTDAVKKLEEDEAWLFEGLQSYEVDRIYAGSNVARAWHRFDRRNLDGSNLPGDYQAGEGIGQFVNQTENATRFNKDRLNILGAVVLIETSALKEKTMRQIADYATIRLLASVSDNVESDPNTPETILTLFNEEFAPASITDFDFAYLEALYDLPPNTRDGTVIAAAVKRYNERQAGKVDD